MENLENKGDINKITPSYSKKEDKKKNNPKFKMKSKLTIIIPIVTISVIALIVFLVYMFIDSFKYKPYIQYESGIDMYSFSKTYNNKKQKTSDSITKSESIKMVLSAVYNESDISGFAKEPTDKYENAIWVDYAKFKGIIGDSEITAENENDKAKYIDVIRYFANAKIKVLDKTLDVNLDNKPKDFESYKQEEQQAIADMINNKIIVQNVNNLKAEKNIFKGQLNELIINFSNKYNTITPEGEKLNINQDKIPKNADQYPYTLASIEKEVYEKPFIIKNEKEFKNPKSVYQDKKAVFDKMKSIAQEHYNNLININYETISNEDFKSKLNEYTFQAINTKEVEEYVKYVKDNKIRVEGNAKAQMPIIYFDGNHYRLRLKLEFKVIYSDTKKNLLYGDFNYMDMTPKLNAVYSKDSYTIYTDVLFMNTKDTNSIYIVESPIYTTTLNKSSTGISLEDKGV